MWHSLQPLVFLLVAAISPMTAQVTCPWQRSDLKPWSLPTTWPSQQVPSEGETVAITEPILLDVSPPPLAYISIHNGSDLVWDIGGRIELKTEGILIGQHGKLQIGSDALECRYPANSTAIVTLTGQRDFSIPVTSEFGQKYIAVEANGSLELHGAEKISWTKLDGTVHKLDPASGLVFNHDDNGRWDVRICGFYVYIVDPASGMVIDDRQFKSSLQGHMDSFLQFLNEIEQDFDGAVMMAAVRDQLVVSGIDYENVYQALEGLGSTRVRDCMAGRVWAMVTVIGSPDSTQEGLSVEKGFIYEETPVVKLFHDGLYYVLQSGRALKGGSYNARSYVRFRVLDRLVQPVINVIDDVSTWLPGDEVIVLSTDYDWTQVEQRTLVPCEECNANQIKLDRELYFTHWGEIEHNIDMRAEVAVLSRNVVVRGEMETSCYGDDPLCDFYEIDIFGGHIKIMANFESARLQGVELVNMGQQSIVSRYPIHFHLCDFPEGPSVIRQNSIHHSFARCITIHRSSGLKIEDNVGYLHFGHCYFLEDGGEKYTEFDGNLGVGTMAGHLRHSDDEPTTYWLTNPLVYLRNNVAGGSDKHGIWFIFPIEPIGMSQGLGLMGVNESASTAILQFENIVGHSNVHTGVFMDLILGTEGEVVRLTNYYRPRTYHDDGTYSQTEVVFSRYTGYKNGVFNAWFRGSPTRWTKCSSADSQEGIIFSIAGGHLQLVEDSSFIGQSDNTGEPYVFMNRTSHRLEKLPRSFPRKNINAPITGFVFYERSVCVVNSWFGGFENDEYRNAGAIGFKRKDQKFSSPINSVLNVTFGFGNTQTGNRVYDTSDPSVGFGDLNGDRHAILGDIDGSLTGVPGSKVVRPNRFVMTNNCYIKSNWNMAVCPDRYFKTQLWTRSLNGQELLDDITLVRDDIHEEKENFNFDNPDAHFSPLLIEHYRYTVHFTGPSPDFLEFRLDAFELGDRVRIGICFPKDTTSFYIKKKYAGDNFNFASNIEDFEQMALDDPLVAFWDSGTGLLFIYFEGRFVRSPDDRHSCPFKKCPWVTIQRLDGGQGPADCYNDAYGPYIMDPVPADDRALSPLPLTEGEALQTPSNMGAGSTRPFLIRNNP